MEDDVVLERESEVVWGANEPEKISFNPSKVKRRKLAPSNSSVRTATNAVSLPEENALAKSATSSISSPPPPLPPPPTAQLPSVAEAQTKAIENNATTQTNHPIAEVQKKTKIPSLILFPNIDDMVRESASSRSQISNALNLAPVSDFIESDWKMPLGLVAATLLLAQYHKENSP